MKDTLVELAVQVAASYVRHNHVPANEVPEVINTVHRALREAGQPKEAEPEAQKPAASLRASVRPDYLVCLECGARAKILKRHLTAAHGLTPEQYREKWRLPEGYPMTAPKYAERRSELAKSIGLGTSRWRGRA